VQAASHPLLATAAAPTLTAPTPLAPTVAPAPAALPSPPPMEAAALVSADRARLDALASDIWIHPLAGPTRRMPIRDGRLFGAERIGDRPSECMGGHCGVDLGGTMGEPVYAVHDGTVERVVRKPNEEHGGHYVRILHREGTIVSQYFHLKSIPAAVQPGMVVKAGDLIGWVGRSGVKRSGPHLHFTISVQEPDGQNGRYVDPEPLVALWPLRATEAGPDGAPQLEQGVPVGMARGFVRRKFRHPKLAAHSRARSADVAD
jgi:murein DD-endopeptidase MepM/ murein hydrolase activator NlpD